MNTPNPNQPHASLATDGTAKTLATLGFTRNTRTVNAVIQAVGGDVRFTLNGTAPTSASGLLIADGQSIQLGEIELDVAKFITGSGSPKLEILSYVG